MVRIAPIRVMSFLLLAPCAALCQSESTSAGFLRRDGPNSLEVQRQEMQAWRSLPDAPSARPSIEAENFRPFAEQARPPGTPGAASINAGRMGETELGRATPGLLASFTAPHKGVVVQQKSSTFLSKYLNLSLVNRSLPYRPSTSGSYIGRAIYAPSHIFVTREKSGKERVNTSYLLGVLTSVAADTAHRPYWTRSASTTFSNFGSTIGGDAGISLFHEFAPGIRQIVKGYAPRFVSKIEQRITHN